MARERGQADDEAGISMRSFGWMAYKKRDATHCPHCGGLVLPGATPGTWDFPQVGVPIWAERRCEFIDVEVKAGITSFPFMAVSDKQRLWAAESPERPKWLWLNMGTAIGRKRYPRITMLFPYELFLAIELSSDRQSIPYGLPTLEPYKLHWEGKRHWSVPESHPIRATYHYL